MLLSLWETPLTFCHVLETASKSLAWLGSSEFAHLLMLKRAYGRWLLVVLVDRIACSSFAFALLLPSTNLANNGGIVTQELDNLVVLFEVGSHLRISSFYLLDFELKSSDGGGHSTLLPCGWWCFVYALMCLWTCSKPLSCFRLCLWLHLAYGLSLWVWHPRGPSKCKFHPWLLLIWWLLVELVIWHTISIRKVFIFKALFPRHCRPSLIHSKDGHWPLPSSVGFCHTVSSFLLQPWTLCGLESLYFLC